MVCRFSGWCVRKFLILVLVIGFCWVLIMWILFVRMFSVIILWFCVSSIVFESLMYLVFVIVIFINEFLNYCSVMGGEKSVVLVCVVLMFCVIEVMC